MNDIVEKKEGTAGEIVLYQPDETIKIEVKLDVEHDTVWHADVATLQPGRF